MDFFTYIVASQRNGTIYTGSTESVVVRTIQHREKRFSGFTAKYGCARLVWYERHPTRHAAFVRERQIKKWNRAWKIQMIEAVNSRWIDLYETLNC